MATKLIIKTTPDSNNMWEGIAGHFDSLDQILCEFIDNSISNFIANKIIARNIVLTLQQNSDKSVRVSIEDSGTGIKNLDAAFSLGNKSAGETPMNEHGFGMKHALASANPSNTHWQICTRTADDQKHNRFKKIEAAYAIGDFAALLVDDGSESWPGDFNTSGTYISFTVQWEMFDTLREGLSGPARLFNTLIDILCEDLGFIYAGAIAANSATITIVATDDRGERSQKSVGAVMPEWSEFYNPPGQGRTKIDLGGGSLVIEYAFGEMAEAKNHRYYKRNMSSSGLEIRLNGRVLAYNVFKAVWGIERHNMYNHFLVTVNLVSDLKAALPATRTSKNGLRQGDPKLEQLFSWVRHMMPEPMKQLALAQSERDLFEELAEHKRTQMLDPKFVSTEQNVYVSIKAKIPIDLYVHSQNQVEIYEGKKKETSVQDVYQLKMYWDGCVLDSLKPTKGYLVASRHPSSVTDLVALVNQMKDLNGNHYNFETKTWRAAGIPFEAD